MTHHHTNHNPATHRLSMAWPDLRLGLSMLITLACAALTFFWSPASAQAVPSPAAQACAARLSAGAIAPDPRYLTLCAETVILYDARARIPRAVAETLTRAKLQGQESRDDDQFREDPRLPGQARALLSDYSRSGYDRGHLAPAADMKYSPAAMAGSFLLSNIAPQQGQFNRNAWAGLESATRACAAQLGSLTVITGTIGGTTTLKEQGRVVIPRYFYKAWISTSGSRFTDARVWIMPNTGAGVPQKKISGAGYATFEVPLATLRQATGLNLAPGLHPQARLCPGVIQLKR